MKLTIKHIIYIVIFVILIGIIYIISKSFITKQIKTDNIVDNIWYSDNDLNTHESIVLSDIHGYVLPHAGTKYTGHIISHTLRFKPTKSFNKVIIMYLPSSNIPDINNKYFHEYYVPYMSIKYFIDNIWNIRNVQYIEHNVLDNKTIEYDNNDLIIVSADFSHFLPLQKAIKLENKAAHAISHRSLDKDAEYIKIIDDVRTFNKLYEIIPDNYILQWIGRTRSPGEKAVGYLSFLIREQADPKKNKPDGLFVTAYDENMQQRECLGEWEWDKVIENELKEKVLRLAATTSRLTSGKFLDIPITNYTITYLYQDNENEFIRGLHGTKSLAFYLPIVFLENTFNNGIWIDNTQDEWMYGNFNMNDTIEQLSMKAGNSSSDIQLYTSNDIYYNISR